MIGQHSFRCSLTANGNHRFNSSYQSHFLSFFFLGGAGSGRAERGLGTSAVSGKWERILVSSAFTSFLQFTHRKLDSILLVPQTAFRKHLGIQCHSNMKVRKSVADLHCTCSADKMRPPYPCRTRSQFASSLRRCTFYRCAYTGVPVLSLNGLLGKLTKSKPKVNQKKGEWKPRPERAA